jgi:hypothetical protein
MGEQFAYAGVLMFMVAAVGAWQYWRQRLESAANTGKTPFLPPPRSSIVNDPPVPISPRQT